MLSSGAPPEGEGIGRPLWGQAAGRTAPWGKELGPSQPGLVRAPGMQLPKSPGHTRGSPATGLKASSTPHSVGSVSRRQTPCRLEGPEAILGRGPAEP